MNEQTQPTDAELIAFATEEQFLLFCDTDEFTDIARAVLAKLGTPAGVGEVVAWLVPHLHTFKGATKVHFTRAPGCTMTDVELMEDLEGRVMWLPSTFSDSPGVTDKFGVHHKPKPLFTTPQPTQAQAGFKSGAKSFQTYAEANAYSKGYYAGKKAATKAQAGAVPLTVDEVEQLIAQWSYEVHGDRARYLVRMTEQHHGIKGADHA